MKRTRNCKLKKHLRHYKPLYAVIFVQILIGLLFVQVLYDSRPINALPLESSVIVVEDICYERGISGRYISVYSNSEEYIFPRLGFHTSYPNGKLFDAITVGDKMFIKYFPKKELFSYKKYIVDAYTESKVLRTIEEYERGKNGVWIFELIIFTITEIFYLVASAGYLWANNLFKIKKK